MPTQSIAQRIADHAKRNGVTPLSPHFDKFVLVSHSQLLIHNGSTRNGYSPLPDQVDQALLAEVAQLLTFEESGVQ